ncbi:MAG: hypothetical protein M3P32_04865 [Chloroflexota bacterium]|nr:hypothetical protein [Chloroflexota bacterium]
MPPVITLSIWLTLGGLLLLGAGLVLVRRSGARPAMGRRLAGARQVRVGELLALGPADRLPPRPIRVSGRVRCADPIVTARDDRLVALHRDVEVAAPGGGWRRIERLRETRSFELWDHDGSLTLDPAEAAEPLVTLPHVWSGPSDELDETYAPAVARVTAEQGAVHLARSSTRMVSVVDRLLVLAVVGRDVEGRAVLAAPRGGYILSAMELDDAMRLLGGRRPRMLLAGAAGVTLSVALFLAAVLLAIVGLATG